MKAPLVYGSWVQLRLLKYQIHEISYPLFLTYGIQTAIYSGLYARAPPYLGLGG